jgi:hypothetical protein
MVFTMRILKTTHKSPVSWCVDTLEIMVRRKLAFGVFWRHPPQFILAHTGGHNGDFVRENPLGCQLSEKIFICDTIDRTKDYIWLSCLDRSHGICEIPRAQIKILETNNFDIGPTQTIKVALENVVRRPRE